MMVAMAMAVSMTVIVVVRVTRRVTLVCRGNFQGA
jgi:hypothetical protein